MDRQGRIVVVGGLNMDLHLFGAVHPDDGGPIVADHHLAMPGGKGANVARAVARLGAPVSLIGCIGDDEFGRNCVDAVAGDGVDVSGVRASDPPTGFVAIELVGGEHRSLVFSPGANDLLTVADVERGLSGIGPGDIVIAQAEIPERALDAVVATTGRCGVSLFLDPAPPWRVRRRHLRGAEVITPDRDEAAALVGRSGDSHLWPALAAQELLTCGARRVVIKLSAEGAMVVSTEDLPTVLPTLDVDVADETGAGDVFMAALAIQRLEGVPWLDAIGFANVASAISVSQLGLVLPTRQEVEHRIRRMDRPVVATPMMATDRLG